MIISNALLPRVHADQALLVPPSLADLIPGGAPVFFLRDIIESLDREPFHRVYRSAKGQPPYHPSLMVGLYLHGSMPRMARDALQRDR